MIASSQENVLALLDDSSPDWLNGRPLRVERGIIRQNVDEVKTTEPRKAII